MMLSHHNMLLPSSGEPTVSPTLDMVLGCYYLTFPSRARRASTEASGGVYGSFREAKLAYDLGMVDLRHEISVRDAKTNGELIETTRRPHHLQ